MPRSHRLDVANEKDKVPGTVSASLLLLRA
jgi:hypothetical protein